MTAETLWKIHQQLDEIESQKKIDAEEMRSLMLTNIMTIEELRSMFFPNE